MFQSVSNQTMDSTVPAEGEEKGSLRGCRSFLPSSFSYCCSPGQSVGPDWPLVFPNRTLLSFLILLWHWNLSSSHKT